MDKEKKQKYPLGWDEDRVRKLAEYYDNQTDEAIAEAFTPEGMIALVDKMALMEKRLAMLEAAAVRNGWRVWKGEE